MAFGANFAIDDHDDGGTAIIIGLLDKKSNFSWTFCCDQVVYRGKCDWSRRCAGNLFSICQLAVVLYTHM